MNKFKITYTINDGITHTQVFSTRENLATFCGSLIEKSQNKQKVLVKAFNGPMALGKHIFNELTAVEG